jgi:hypothetical protein
LLRGEVAAASSVSVLAAPSAEGRVKAAHGAPAGDELARASLALAS